MGLAIFFKWWYTEGWVNAFASITKRLNTVADDLSIPILARTLFEPWKQIKLNTGQNTPIDLKIHVLAENLFSRFFGFFIRTFVIIFGFFALIFVAIFGLVLAMVWPLIPLLPIVFLYMAAISV